MLFTIKYRGITLEVSWLKVSLKRKDLTVETSPVLILLLLGLINFEDVSYLL